jgi:HSP20 family protein
LRLHIPVAEKAKPRKINVARGNGHRVLNETTPQHEVINA